MISQRAVELTVAALAATFGVAVVVSSLYNGIGWSEAGVDAGTFPFLIGILIVLGSAYNFVCGAADAHAIAITTPAFRRVAGLFIPAAIYIAAIPALGMYVASGGYMFAALGLRSGQSTLRTVLLSVATPLALYWVFERLFVVSLPHGALFAMFGL